MWDFQKELGVDVISYFTRELPWLQFWSYFSQLPEGSKTKAIIAMDEELAEAQASRLTEEEIRKMSDSRMEKSPPPPIEGYNRQMELLSMVVDEVKLLRMSMSSEKKPFVPAPRPVTALQSKVEKRIKDFELQEGHRLLGEFGF